MFKEVQGKGLRCQWVRFTASGVCASDKAVVGLGSKGLTIDMGAQDTGNTSYILALGQHMDPKTPATNRALGNYFEHRGASTSQTSCILAPWDDL